MKFLLSLAFILPLAAERLTIPASLFKSAEFKANFVGTYGFLPNVEPKVSRDELDFLRDLSDPIEKGQLKQAEALIKQFAFTQKNPPKLTRKQRKAGEVEKLPQDLSPAFDYILGNIYLQSGQNAKAEAAYKKAISLHPPYRRAHKNLALLYSAQNQLPKAKPHVEKAIDLGESDHLIYGIMANIHFQDEKFLAAETAFRQAYLLNPKNPQWKLGLAQSLLSQEKWSEASVMLQALIDEAPEKALLWKQQANCFVQMDEILRAAENFEILRLKGLADADTLTKLGDIYVNKQEPLLALGAYLSAMKKSNAVDVARSLKTAGYLLRLDAPEQAKELLDEIDKRAGDSMSKNQKIESLLVRSDAAKSQDKLEEAASHLKAALEIKPGHGEAQVRLGQIHLARAEAEEDEAAAKTLKQEARTAFTLAMSSPDPKVAYQANLRYAQSVARDGDYIKALPKAREAVRLKEGNKQLVEQYLRRIQRAAERQEARLKREQERQNLPAPSGS
ncbi:MAG: tetratricopeptide repeat protein [Akkermansiaceae bacterium]